MTGQAAARSPATIFAKRLGAKPKTARRSSHDELFSGLAGRRRGARSFDLLEELFGRLVGLALGTSSPRKALARIA
jgi:hypothetical protein